MVKNIKACLSHNSDEWETPCELFKSLNDEFKFDIDLYASESNHLCSNFYTKEKPLNELIQDHIIYANPPYSKLSQCIEMCYYLSFFNKVVMLIPARTDTIAFHKYLYNNSVEIRFIKGRIKFCKNGRSMGSAPFPSMICILDNREIYLR